MTKKRLLLHICCAPDATIPWPELISEEYETAGYFYGGNIHPAEEYERRLEAVRALAAETRGELVVPAYETDEWFAATRGLEDEPERGARCAVCFRVQLEAAAAKLHLWAFMGNDKLHKRAFSMEKRIEKLSQTERPKMEKRLHAAFKEREFRGDEVLTAEGLTKGYEGRALFSGLSLDVTGGERIAIIGENGSGKTTLVKLIVGEEEPDAGWIRRGPAVKFAYLPQHVKFAEPERTAADTLIYDCRCSPQEARDSLGAFGFSGEDALKAVGTLSGGEQSRLRLCMLMRGDINLLILDEPTNHLDLASREWMEDAVADYSEALIFVSHDRYFIEKFATRIWALENGQLTDFRGSFSEYRAYRARQEALAQAAKAAAPKPEKKPQRKKGTPEREREARRCEREIEKLESRLREIEREAGEHASDYQRLMELEDEKARIDPELDALYSRWEELQDEE